MEQTFTKHFRGYDVEFNKLLFPARYQVFIKIPDKNPVTLIFEKNDREEWATVDQDLPEWITALLPSCMNIINEAEAQSDAE